MKIRYSATRNLSGILLTLMMSGLAHAADLNAQLYSNRISMDDTVLLKLTLESSDKGQAPELSPLNKDFHILNSGMSSSTQVINGVRTDSVSWDYTLAPNRTGQLIIPSLTVGNASSQPLTLEVVEAGTIPNDPALEKAVNIEVLIDEKSHYIHEEIPLTIRINDHLGMGNMQLLTPTSHDFTLTQTGSDKAYQDTSSNGGKIIERSFLLKPTTSGKITVPPFQLQGTLPTKTNTQGGRNQRFGQSVFSQSPFAASLFGPSLFDQFMQQGEPTKIHSAPIAIDVKASPIQNGSWFLPAKKVKLDAQWDKNQPSFSVGSAVTRTVRLMALGASKEQLPDLNLPTVDGARLYLDHSQDRSVDTDEGTAAIREFDISVVPTRDGNIILPAIEVQWWDTVNDKQQTATLPAETIVVQAAATGSTTQAPSTPPVSIASMGDQSALAEKHATDSSTDNTTSSKNTDSAFKRAFMDHLSVALALLSAVIAAFLILFLHYRKQAKQTSTSNSLLSQNTPKQEIKKLEQRIQKHAMENHAQHTWAAFNAWYCLIKPGSILSSEALSDYSPGLSDRFKELESALYSVGNDQDWNGSHFATQFAQSKRRISNGSKRSLPNQPLPNLYPNPA